MYSEVILDASGQARYRFRTERTATLGLDAKSLEDELEKEENVEAILFGSVSLMLEPAASSIFRAVSEYKKKHPRVTIFLDPNIRSSLITEFNKYRVWMKDVVKLADIVKMSDEDLLLLTGKPYDQGVREFKTINQCDLIITRGAKGSEWHRGRKVFKAQAANIRIVDTIGAGDTFNGVLLWGLHSLGRLPKKFTDDECKELLGIAAHAADIDCTRRGCNPPTKEELFES
jgi:fructokinase